MRSINNNASSSLIRLNKLLSQQRVCSRREADAFIRQGLIEVNGSILSSSELGIKIDPERGDTYRLLPEATRQLQSSLERTAILNKPLGVISCQPESPEQIPAIRICTPENEFHHPIVGKEGRGRGRSRGGNKRQQQQRRPSAVHLPPCDQQGYAVAGRLDINSTGLLVLTQSGKIASQLIGGNEKENNTRRIEKEYLVRISSSSSSSPSALSGNKGPLLIDDNNSNNNSNNVDRRIQHKLDELRDGIYDDGDDLYAKSIDIINENQLRFVLTEGKHHHIRRMCTAVGWNVQALKRVRIGNIMLGNLPLGYWRYLNYPNETF